MAYIKLNRGFSLTAGRRIGRRHCVVSIVGREDKFFGRQPTAVILQRHQQDFFFLFPSPGRVCSLWFFLPAVQLCCHTVAGHCLWRGVTKVWPLKQLIFPSISVDLVPVVLIEVDKKGEMEKKGQWRLRQRVTQVEFIKIKLKIRSQKRTWSPTTHLKQQLVLWARGLHSILDREALSLVSLICSRYNPRVAWCSDAAACVPVSWCYSKVPLYKKTHCRESVSQSAR